MATSNDRNYLQWMLEQSYYADAMKTILREALVGRFPVNPVQTTL